MSLAIEMRNITKRFPGVLANDRIKLEIREREIHSLLGENGSGKTTLMNILFGLYQADEGEILINGNLTQIRNPKDALQLGIGMVHQHFMLVNRMNVLENIILGYEDGNYKLNLRDSYRKVNDLSEKYGFNLDLNAMVEDLPVGIRQKVEIIKTLYRGAEVIILDEPTAVLTPQEVDDLFIILSELKKKGKSIIFITHKLNETMEIADQITVLRKGQNVISMDKNSTNPQELARYMVGREVNFKLERTRQNLGPCIMAFHDIQLMKKAKNPIDLEIHSGEILGIAGVEGNGQLELEEIIMGLRQVKAGSLTLAGQEIVRLSTHERKNMSLGYIPSDRHKRAILEKFSLHENMLLGYQFDPDFSHRGIIQWKSLKKHTQDMIRQFAIKAENVEEKISNLSGGNQQKVVLAREISQGPLFILAAQPTRGLDIGAVEYIHSLLLQLRNEGKAILLISADLSEVMECSDRIAVLYEGEIVAIKDSKEFAREEIGRLMAGEKRGDIKNGVEEK
jgi:simple sugar transport system ATP-binding protein